MPQKEEKSAGHLLRVLGLAFGLAVGVGTMIGGGILRTPGEVADRVPDIGLVLALWFAGGVHALLGANVIAEISTSVPKAGGLYVPTRRAFGDFAGLLVGWSDWLVNAAAAAALALAFADFAALIDDDLAATKQAIAASLLLSIIGLNWLGVREGSAVQKVGSLAKCLILLALVAAMFILLPPAPARAVDGIASGITIAGAIVAYQLVYGVFSGWPAPVLFVEEDSNASANLPRALILSVLTVTAVYLLLNAAIIYSTPVHALAKSDLALGPATEAIFGDMSTEVCAVAALVIVASCLNGVVMVLPRILYGLGRDGLFLRVATRVNKGGSPDVALGISALVGVALIVTGTFETVFLLMGALVIFTMIVSEVSLFGLRYREPELARPFKARGYPFLPALVLLIDTALLGAVVWADPVSGLYMFFMIGLAVPVYFLTRARGTREAITD